MTDEATVTVETVEEKKKGGFLNRLNRAVVGGDVGAFEVEHVPTPCTPKSDTFHDPSDCFSTVASMSR